MKVGEVLCRVTQGIHFVLVYRFVLQVQPRVWSSWWEACRWNNNSWVFEALNLCGLHSNSFTHDSFPQMFQCLTLVGDKILHPKFQIRCRTETETQQNVLLSFPPVGADCNWSKSWESAIMLLGPAVHPGSRTGSGQRHVSTLGPNFNSDMFFWKQIQETVRLQHTKMEDFVLVLRAPLDAPLHEVRFWGSGDAWGHPAMQKPTLFLSTQTQTHNTISPVKCSQMWWSIEHIFTAKWMTFPHRKLQRITMEKWKKMIVQCFSRQMHFL